MNTIHLSALGGTVIGARGCHKGTQTPSQRIGSLPSTAHPRSVGVLVQGFVAVDDVHGEDLERGVADDLESTVVNVAQVQDGRARLEAFGRATRALDQRALQYVARLDAVMEVPSQLGPGW